MLKAALWIFQPILSPPSLSPRTPTQSLIVAAAATPALPPVLPKRMRRRPRRPTPRHQHRAAPHSPTRPFPLCRRHGGLSPSIWPPRAPIRSRTSTMSIPLCLTPLHRLRSRRLQRHGARMRHCWPIRCSQAISRLISHSLYLRILMRTLPLAQVPGRRTWTHSPRRIPSEVALYHITSHCACRNRLVTSNLSCHGLWIVRLTQSAGP